MRVLECIRINQKVDQNGGKWLKPIRVENDQSSKNKLLVNRRNAREFRF
jgi:hypothetical protein